MELLPQVLTPYVTPQGSMAKESGAEDATTFISQLKYFKQKRKGGLILGINCSREVPLPSRADNINWIAVISQILTAKYLQNQSSTTLGWSRKATSPSTSFVHSPHAEKSLPRLGAIQQPNCLELHPVREQGENEQNGQEGQDQELIKLFSLLPASIQEFCSLPVECRCPKRKVKGLGAGRGTVGTS